MLVYFMQFLSAKKIVDFLQWTERNNQTGTATASHPCLHPPARISATYSAFRTFTYMDPLSSTLAFLHTPAIYSSTSPCACLPVICCHWIILPSMPTCCYFLHRRNKSFLGPSFFGSSIPFLFSPLQQNPLKVLLSAIPLSHYLVNPLLAAVYLH